MEQNISFQRNVICSCSGVPRSGNARSVCPLYAPVQNCSIEQWRMVVIVIGYTLCVTSQYDVLFTFANQRFGEVC